MCDANYLTALVYEYEKFLKIVALICLLCDFGFVVHYCIHDKKKFFANKKYLIAGAMEVIVIAIFIEVKVNGIREPFNLLVLVLMLIVSISMIVFYSFPGHFVHCVSFVCPPERNIDSHLGVKLIRHTHYYLELNSFYMKRYGQFIYSLEIRGNDVKGEDVWHLLKHCTKLRRLHLVDVVIHDLPLNEA